jgi:hypothetical protein
MTIGTIKGKLKKLKEVLKNQASQVVHENHKRKLRNPGVSGLSAKNLKKKTHNYTYGPSRLARWRGVAEWRLSSLNFGSQKFVLMENAKRPPQTKFQLPNMLGSREIKSQKIAYHLYRSCFLMKCPILPYK